jgi:hypothetical protein
VSELLVDAKDLKALVSMLIELEIDRRCYVASINRALAHDQPLRSKFADEFDSSKKQEAVTVQLRYRELMNALDSGENIRPALSKFARQEGFH